MGMYFRRLQSAAMTVLVWQSALVIKAAGDAQGMKVWMKAQVCQWLGQNMPLKGGCPTTGEVCCDQHNWHQTTSATSDRDWIFVAQQNMVLVYITASDL
jgi:hypothetical protein